MVRASIEPVQGVRGWCGEGADGRPDLVGSPTAPPCVARARSDWERAPPARLTQSQPAFDLTFDPRTNQITEVWVVWQERPHFYFSGPDDRHYVVERTSARIIFGDGVHGKLPPVGPGNIRARIYQAGGGQIGNVQAGAISQIMSGVLASSVSNPRAAEGGADGETTTALLSRGPNVFRHMERGMSASDYEALAREASPAIAAVRVLPATASNGRPAAGSITVVIVPQSSGMRNRNHPTVCGRRFNHFLGPARACHR